MVWSNYVIPMDATPDTKSAFQCPCSSDGDVSAQVVFADFKYGKFGTTFKSSSDATISDAKCAVCVADTKDFVEIAKNKDDDKNFGEQSGKCLKRGMHEDSTNRVKVAELMRYRTSKSGDKFISFNECVYRMVGDNVLVADCKCGKFGTTIESSSEATISDAMCAVWVADTKDLVQIVKKGTIIGLFGWLRRRCKQGLA